MTPTEKAMKNIQERAAHVNDLLNNPTPAARIELVNLISRAVSFHKSGKIEGIFSLDVACSNCEFCRAMQREADFDQICAYCYTGAMYDTAKAAHAITGEILSRLELTPDEAAAVCISLGLIRFNCDGEIINKTHAANLLRIAAAHPKSTFAIWTKRPGLLGQAIEKEGRPGNLIIGASSHLINRPAYAPYPFIDFVFTVYTPRGIERAIKAGCRECNGKKCKDCGYKCYRTFETGPHPIHVAEILRRPHNMTQAAFNALCERLDGFIY